MSNRLEETPYLEYPPIHDKPFNDEGFLSDSWTNWVTSITRTTGYAITHDHLVEPGPNPPNTNAGQRSDTFQLQCPKMIETQLAPNTELGRDELDNARDGTIIYNTTTGRFNFREGGAWVTFTAVPA